MRDVLINANLQAVRTQYKQHYNPESWPYDVSEDWLGYLGVAMFRTRFVPGHLEQVGLAWRGQLNLLAGTDLAPDSPVTFEELEQYETELEIRAYSRPGRPTV